MKSHIHIIIILPVLYKHVIRQQNFRQLVTVL